MASLRVASFGCLLVAASALPATAQAAPPPIEQVLDTGTGARLRTEKDRARWDPLLIRRGLDALARAEALGGDGRYCGSRDRTALTPRTEALVRSLSRAASVSIVSTRAAIRAR